jgi:methyl-accepting chemotaxis protein
VLAGRDGPAAAPGAALDDAIAARLARCRERFDEVTGHAIRTSEREVLAAGSVINDIFFEAREQSDELGRAAGALEGEHGIGSVAALIAEQSDACRSFLGRLTSDLREQNEQIGHATSLTSSIAEAGHVIRDVADQTRILTVNALIEAAHLGENGRSVAVIAKEMGELSKAVRDANERIAALVRALVAVLPALADRSRRLVGESNDFSDRAAGGLELASSKASALGAAVAESIASRERRLQRVLSLSQAAISNLQFQDPMAQELSALRHCFDGLEAEVLDALAVARSGNESAALVLQRAPEPTPDRDETPALESGEVLLFPAAH